MADHPTRRQFFLVTAGSVAAVALTACKSGGSGEGGGGGSTGGTGGGGGGTTLTCTDVTGLSAGDVQVRTTLGYADSTPDPTKKCTACFQWLPAAPGTCGGCRVIKGPIHPDGTCKAFVARPS